MPLTESQLTALASELQAALARAAPEWTEGNSHDPGVTVLEVLAYVLTDLHDRRRTLTDRVRQLARDVAERAGALAVPTAGNGETDCEAGLQRVNFVQGMVLGADDFRAEQDYARLRLNRRNRMLHGMGIVSGLEVTVRHDTSGSSVVIEPGLAFDRAGNEICLDRPRVHALATQGGHRYVVLAYAEQLCRNVATIANDVLDAPTTQPVRIAETFRVELADAPATDELAIARLRQVRGRWRIDPTFKASRTRT
jgi:hypothetical protein